MTKVSRNCEKCSPFDCADRVERCRAGDRQACEELARKFDRTIWKIVIEKLGEARRYAWDEAHAEIWEHVVRNWMRWEGRCPFCKWVGLIAGRKAINIRTAIDREAGRVGPLGDRDPPPPPPADPPEVSEEQKACVERRLKEFPPQWQEMWWLHYDRVEKASIAARYGMHVRAVHYRLAQMKDRLAGCFQEKG